MTISKENLKNAIEKTFKKRETDIKSIDKVIDEILGFGGNDKSEKKQSDFYDDEDDEIDFNWDDDEEEEEEELPKAKKIKAVKRKK